MFIEEIKNWRIDSIVPVEVATRYAEALDSENISKEEIKNIIFNSSLWSAPKMKRFIGMVCDLLTEGAFGDWYICKFNHGRARNIVQAFNNTTKEYYYLSNFELYVVIKEFQIHKFNSLCINAFEGATYKKNEETDNTEKFINDELVEVIPPLGKIQY